LLVLDSGSVQRSSGLSFPALALLGIFLNYVVHGLSNAGSASFAWAASSGVSPGLLSHGKRPSCPSFVGVWCLWFVFWVFIGSKPGINMASMPFIEGAAPYSGRWGCSRVYSLGLSYPGAVVRRRIFLPKRGYGQASSWLLPVGSSHVPAFLIERLGMFHIA